MEKSLFLLKWQARAYRYHGLTEEQFLDLTPGELRALDKEYFEELRTLQECDDWRIARLQATVWNCTPGRKRRDMKEPKAFMPKMKKAQQSEKDMIAVAKGIGQFVDMLEKRKSKNG